MTNAEVHPNARSVSFHDRIAVSLGSIPSIETRSTLAMLRRYPTQRHVTLRYEWIKDWTTLEGLEMNNGEGWVGFHESK